MNGFMKDFIITTDTTTDLPASYVNEHHLGMMSLPYTIENQTYTWEHSLPEKEFYAMMQQVYEVFQELDGGNVEAIIQEPGMNEEKREAFLAEFSAEREKTLIAFCVMGGIFGEGIDLKKEQLIGAVIVGTGLPQISNEREILMDYYEKRMGEGFDYAYRYPGMNKVLQAAGRVIRTIDDVGVIELLDERFLQSDYRNLFPKEWEKRLVCTVDSVESYLEKFWEEKQ